MHGRSSVLLAVLGGLGFPAVHAQEAQGTQEEHEAAEPDLAFLEYLGSWQEDDTEWLMVAEWDDDAPPPADGKPEPVREDSDE